MTTENQLLGAARQNGGRVAQLIEQALEQRLLARARATDVSLVRLRKAVAFDP